VFLPGLLLFGAGILGWGTAAWVTGRSRYPESERRAAWSAISEARKEGAERWAPDALDRSEAAYRGGVEKARRESGRFYPVRDYRTARDCFVCTGARARYAATAAGEERESARSRAARALEQARAAKDDMNALVLASALTRPTERLRHRAAVRLAGAEGHFEVGEYPLALRRARESEAMMKEISERARSRVSRYVDPEVRRTWRRWVDETIRESRAAGTAAIVVVKEANRLDLYSGGALVRSFKVDLGRNRLGRKLQVGDLATPEGRYSIIEKKGAGSSRYHMALLLDYPTEADRRRLTRAKEAGAVALETSPGRWIEIHGEGGRGTDWTAGCVALSNSDIEALFAAVTVGTPVTIVGGDGPSGPISTLAGTLGKRSGS
jgi:hypothetical protein